MLLFMAIVDYIVPSLSADMYVFLPYVGHFDAAIHARAGIYLSLYCYSCVPGGLCEELVFIYVSCMCLYLLHT